MTVQTDHISKETFHEFCEIQRSGRYNMVDNAVATELGISRNEHMQILSDYEKLADIHGTGE